MINLVAHGITGDVAGAGITLDTTGANLIAIYVPYWPADGPPVPGSIAETGYTNTWIATTPQTDGISIGGRWFYCLNPNVGSGHVFKLTGAVATYSSMEVIAFSGVASFDQQTGQFGTGVSGTLTPSANKALCLAGFATNQGSGVTETSSLTLLDSLDYVTGNYMGCYVAYQIQGPAAAAQAVWAATTPPFNSCSTILTFLAEPDVAGPQVILASTGLVLGSGSYANDGLGGDIWHHNPTVLCNVPWSVDGVFDSIRIDLNTAPGTGVTRTGTVKKGTDFGAASSTGVTITISGASTSGTTSGPVSVSAGEYIYIDWVTTGGTAATSTGYRYCALFTPTTAGQQGYSHFFGDHFGSTFGDGIGKSTPFWPTFTTSAVSYYNNNAGFGASAAENLAAIMRVAGTLKRVDFRAWSAPGSGKTVQWCVWKALAATPDTFVKQDGSGGTVDTRCQISGTGRTGMSTFDLPLAVGDRVYIGIEDITPQSTISYFSFSIRFDTDNPGTSQLGGWFGGQLTNGPWYITPQGQGAGNATSNPAEEGLVECINNTGQSFPLTGMVARLSLDPGVGKQYDFVIRKNGVDTAIAFSIVGNGSTGKTGGSTNGITIGPGDRYSLKVSSPSFIPTNPQVTWAFTQGTPPPTVDAGPDQVLWLPDSSTVLAGSATDPDGSIVAYLWEQLSGPATITFADPTDPTTAVTFIPAVGTYILRLTATDDDGNTASDEMTITLNEALDAEDCPSGSIQLFIDDVDVTDNWSIEEATIEYTMGSPGTLDLLIIDKALDRSTAYRPSIGQVIRIVKTVRMFTGKIVSSDEETLVDQSGTGTRIEAIDYQRSLARRFFTKNYDPYAYATEPPADGTCAMTTERSVISVADFFGTNSVVTAYPHLLQDGDRITFVGVSGSIPDVNGQEFIVTENGDDTFFIDGTPLTSPGSGGKVVKLVQVNEIFADILPYLAEYGITVSIENIGPWIPAPNFSLATLEDVINYAVGLAEWVYRMTPYKLLQAFTPGAITAPFELRSDTASIIGGVPQRRTREDYANALYVKGGKAGSQRTELNRRETWIGDGVSQTFPLADPDSWTIGNNCTHPGVMYVDGVTGPLTGIHPDDDGILEWTWDPETKTLHHTIGEAPAEGTVIELAYAGPENFVIYVKDQDAIDDNDGEIEEAIVDAGEDATQATAHALGLVELARRTVTERRAQALTDLCMVLPGTVIPVDLPQQLMTGDWLVVTTTVSINEAREKNSPSEPRVTYLYELLEAGIPTTWIDFWKSLV